jgi:hypothetical protein
MGSDRSPTALERNGLVMMQNASLSAQLCRYSLLNKLALVKT